MNDRDCYTKRCGATVVDCIDASELAAAMQWALKMRLGK